MSTFLVILALSRIQASLAQELSKGYAVKPETAIEIARSVIKGLRGSEYVKSLGPLSAEKYLGRWIVKGDPIRQHDQISFEPYEIAIDPTTGRVVAFGVVVGAVKRALKQIPPDRSGGLSYLPWRQPLKSGFLQTETLRSGLEALFDSRYLRKFVATEMYGGQMVVPFVPLGTRFRVNGRLYRSIPFPSETTPRKGIVVTSLAALEPRKESREKFAFFVGGVFRQKGELMSATVIYVDRGWKVNIYSPPH